MAGRFIEIAKEVVLGQKFPDTKLEAHFELCLAA
jgi:hypothetical protein